ncbi:MAG: NADH:ubiquinone reductase (Na(+)-transporting) subunit D, partial [Chlamydiia bacterium]|nr:NADH:ubiquinone reductase (Na(+)-transporting) subunit D [Chlamydiia bacterium]
MSQKALPLKTYFMEPLWKNNQILVAILGICSALGVTSSLTVAITMGISVTFVTGCSSLLVSLLRHKTPDSVRMITQLAVISTFVTIVDQLLKAYLFDLSKTLSVYVGLIITNCLVMGRAEGLAKSVPPIPAFLDGIAAGLGYAFVLFAVAFFRELMGFGTLFGMQMIPDGWYATAAQPDAYQNFGIMLTPP